MKKRTFLLLVVVILATVGLGTLVVEHQGYVLISWKNIRFEATLWVFLLCLLLLLAVLYALRVTLGLLFRSAGWVNPWSGKNRKKRLENSINKGLLSYSEGNWSEALKQLGHAGKASEQPLPYLLAAARSAEQLQQGKTSDELLLLALKKHSSNELPAIALCQADILLSRNEPEKALQILQKAYEKHSTHPELLVRLSQLAHQQQDWSQQLKLLPALRKIKHLDPKKTDQLEYQAWQGRISQPAESMQQVQDIWDTLPSALHKQPCLLMAYCSQYIHFKQPEQAERLLRQQLNQKFDVQLLQAYAQVPHTQPGLAVKNAERWLEQAPDDAVALYALGKLCLQAELWGKARDYLQSSLVKKPQPKVYAELARLLNEMGDYKRSIQLLTASINMQDRLIHNHPDNADQH